MTTPSGPSGPAGQPWAIEQARIDRNWRAITIELDAPRPSRMERLLRTAGLPAHVTRLVVATPALRRAWFLATGFAILVGLAGTNSATPRAELFLFLLLAPIVPVLGVSMAYGPDADPAHEMTVATPLRGLRLIGIRAVVVLAFSSFWLLLASLLASAGEAAPGGLIAFSWLLPSLGLTAATVALMTFVSPRRAAATTGVTWMIGVLLVRGGAADPLAAFTVAGQAVMFAIAVVAAGLTVVRRDRFDRLTAQG